MHDKQPEDTMQYSTPTPIVLSTIARLRMERRELVGRLAGIDEALEILKLNPQLDNIERLLSLLGR
jgi:hypothetical protein